MKIFWIILIGSCLISCEKRDSLTGNSPESSELGIKFSDPATLKVTTFSGGIQSDEPIDGPRLMASYLSPYGIVSSSDGTIYISDSGIAGIGSIRKITSDGIVSTIPLHKSYFPRGLAIGNDGSLYLIEIGKYFETNGSKILRRIFPDGRVQYLEVCELAPDGSRIRLQLDQPYDLAVAPDGTIFITDSDNDRIIKRTTDGIATILAGGERGYADGPLTSAKFNFPMGIALDDDGNLYVADAGNKRFRKIASDGEVTTIAGSGEFAVRDGIGENASFYNPNDVVIVDEENLIISDNLTVRTINLNTRVVRTVAGTPDIIPSVDGPALNYRFGGIEQVALFNDELYITDGGHRRILKLSEE